MDFDGDDQFAGLIVFGWDHYANEPLAAITVEPWDDLTADQERLVWQQVANVALDYCSLAMPNTVDDVFPE